MKDKIMKRQIDLELGTMIFTDHMRENVLNSQKQPKIHVRMRYAAISLLIFFGGGTTAFAGYCFFNKVNVNAETLPELDEMKAVNAAPIGRVTDEYGRVCKTFTDY